MNYIEQLKEILSHEQVTTNEVLRTQHGKMNRIMNRIYRMLLSTRKRHRKLAKF